MVCQNPFFSDFSPILSLTAGSFSCALQGVFVSLFFVLHYVFYKWHLVLVVSKHASLDVKLL